MCRDADGGTIGASASSWRDAGPGRRSNGGACGSSHTATRAFPLPSDGWKPGQPETGVILTGDFDASITSHGACAWLGPARYVILWPAGYRVKFHPTELIGPAGQVVARAGQYIGFEGGHVARGMPALLLRTDQRCIHASRLSVAQTVPVQGRDTGH